MKKRKFAFFAPNDDGTVDITIRPDSLTPEQLEEFENYTDVVFYLQPVVLSIEAVVSNYRDLKAVLAKSEEQLNRENRNPFPSMKRILHGQVFVIQKFNAFLSSATTFLYLAENDLKRKYGQGSNEFSEFNSLRQNLHASNFSYRFLYDLRNFSQHYALPITSLDLHSSRPTLTEDLEIYVELSFQRDKLLASGWNWKEELRKDIEGQPEQILALPLIDQYLLILMNICLAFALPERERTADAFTYFNALRETLGAPLNADLVTILGGPVQTPTHDHLNAKFEVIPIDQLSWIVEKLERIRQTVAGKIVRRQESDQGNT